MAVAIICSDFGAQEKKICHYFHFFCFFLPWIDRTQCHEAETFDKIQHSFIRNTKQNKNTILYIVPKVNIKWDRK